MRITYLPGLLLACVAMGQAGPAPVPSSTSLPDAVMVRSTNVGKTPQLHPSLAAVAPDTPVIMVTGLCDDTPVRNKNPRGTTVSKTGADCKTVITREQFDALAVALQPEMNSDTRRQLAIFYPKLLLMQREFRKRGLEKDPHFKNSLAFAQLRAEAEWTARMLKEDADHVSAEDVEKSYKENAASYEQAELQRIFIPKAKQQPSAKDNKQEPAKSPEEQKADEEALKKEADALQSRAASGEDFDKLQKEAYDAAGIQVISPSTKLGTQTANQLPTGHQSVLTLGAGDVSQVIADGNGYFIYKVVSRSTKPLEQARAEIKDRLAQQRFTIAMQTIDRSAKTEVNEAYFPQTSSDGLVRPGNGALGDARPGARPFAGKDANSRSHRVGVKPPVPRPVPPSPSAGQASVGSAAPEGPEN